MMMTMMMMMMMPLCNLPAAADFVVRGLAGPTSCCLRHHHDAQGGDRYHQRYDDHGEGKGRRQKKKSASGIFIPSTNVPPYVHISSIHQTLQNVKYGTTSQWGRLL